MENLNNPSVIYEKKNIRGIYSKKWTFLIIVNIRRVNFYTNKDSFVLFESLLERFINGEELEEKVM